MNELESIVKLFEIDWVSWVVTCFLIMFGIVSAFNIIGKVSVIIGKPVKWINSKNNDHELLTKVIQSVDEIKQQMATYTENRISDRKQSFEIQKKLTDSIELLSKTDEKRDGQIDSLMNGMMELLGDRIDGKFSKYVALGGIPEDEVDEFIGICHAYFGTGGNHKREEKYKYVRNNMKILPTQTHLVNKQ